MPILPPFLVDAAFVLLFVTLGRRNHDEGTAVAGVIKAEHNGMGLAGLAPAVKLLPIRIFKNGIAGGIRHGTLVAELCAKLAVGHLVHASVKATDIEVAPS